MTQKKSEQKTKATSKVKPAVPKPYSKPRITRHGNMRRLTQMSG